MKKPTRRTTEAAEDTVVVTARLVDYEQPIDSAIEKAIEETEARLKRLRSLKSDFQNTTVRVVEEAKENLAAILK